MDTRSGTRGAVPIALGSASGETEEGRAFFQARLALYGGWVGLSSAGFLVAYALVTSQTGDHIAVTSVRVGDPNLYHLAATLVAAALWGIAYQPKRLSIRTLELLEALGTVIMCTCFAMMAIGFVQAHLSVSQDPMHGLLGGMLACSYVLLSRAVAIPSTPLRSLIVSAVALLPIAIAGPYSAMGASVPGVNLTAFIDIPVWSIAAASMAVVASRVIFGLRAEVDKVRRLGQYTLEDKLGEGGMGVVYRARHAMLRRPTAIKILKPETASEEGMRRFEREVQLTASLSHPSTVAIFDYGRTPQGLFYYAMEYLDGLSLEQLVRADGKQPPPRVAHILRQICGALGEAHAVGLIHRDVKPANIILSERGGMPDIAKVVDFGLVKSFEADRSPDNLEVTTANVLVGTPFYMSPEAISGDKTLDGRSDLYALGAVGYFLLTGAPVFQSKTIVEVFAHHLHTPPEPPSLRSGAYIPDDLERIILRCLSKRPEDRYDGAKSLQHALDKCAENTPWDNDVALKWWARYRSRPRNGAPPSPSVGEQTITIDVTQRVARG